MTTAHKSAITTLTINGLTLTSNAVGFLLSGGTTPKTLTISNTLTFAGTDTSTLNIGTGGTLGTGAFAIIANYAPIAFPAFTGIPSAINYNTGYTTTVTAAGTTTLSSASTEQNFFTGTTTQTVVLPVSSTMVLGQRYFFRNNSTGVVTAQSSGLNTVLIMPSNTRAVFTCILTSGTDQTSWSASYVGFSTLTGAGAVVLATSPVLVTPTLTSPAITAASAATVGAKVTGVASQTADIFQILAAGPTILASVTAAGILIEQQPAVTALVTSGAITLTVAQILTRITTQNQTVAATFTLPTGTLMDGGFNALFNNMSIDWSIINIGSTSGAVTMAVGTAHTYVGSTSIPITTSARFRSVRTAVATWVTYRTS